MPDRVAIEQFRRRLVERGCPAARMRRYVQELADHHEDLKNAALEEGLSEAAAAARADEALGEPVALADHLAAALRRSSWWGRHPIIGFCLLPPVGIVAAVIAGLFLEFLLGKLYFTKAEIGALVDDETGFWMFQWLLAGTYYGSIALTAMLFCFLARRSASGWKWAVAACAVCSLHGYFCFLEVVPHRFTVGYLISNRLQHVTAPAIPLLVLAAAGAWRWWTKWRLAPLPVPATRGRTPVKVNPHRNRFLTPSSLIAAVLVVATVCLVVWVRTTLADWRARETKLKTEIWPAERAAVVSQLHTRQSVGETSQATTIPLKPFVNLSLQEAADPSKSGNDLAALPEGIHLFGGVPFDVQGRIQLMGDKLSGRRLFPSRVKNMPVGRKCTRIHLLHGAGFLDQKMFGMKIASLVLHYADGSRKEIAIVAGEHVLDWWGPIYITDVPETLRRPTSPGTELAWTGSNPRIQAQLPEASLRLYRSTFSNPEPDREIASIDYVSARTDAAPFLVGLTVE